MKNLFLTLLFSFSIYQCHACECIFNNEDYNDSEFIALVEVKSVYGIQIPEEGIPYHSIDFETIELFKGDSELAHLYVDGGNRKKFEQFTSCDIGINEGEEWLVFAKNIEGQLTIKECSLDTKIYPKKYDPNYGIWDYAPNHYLGVDKELRKVRKHFKSRATGERKMYYKNGQLKQFENYRNGELNGTFISYYPNGNLQIEQNFINNELQGAAKIYSENGHLIFKGNYKDDKPIDTLWNYYEDGVVKEINFYIETPEEWSLPAWSKSYFNTGQIESLTYRKETEEGLMSYHKTYHPNSRLSYYTLWDGQGNNLKEVEFYSNGNRKMEKFLITEKKDKKASITEEKDKKTSDPFGSVGGDNSPIYYIKEWDEQGSLIFEGEKSESDLYWEEINRKVQEFNKKTNPE